MCPRAPAGQAYAAKNQPSRMFFAAGRYGTLSVGPVGSARIAALAGVAEMESEPSEREHKLFVEDVGHALTESWTHARVGNLALTRDLWQRYDLPPIADAERGRVVRGAIAAILTRHDPESLRLHPCPFCARKMPVTSRAQTESWSVLWLHREWNETRAVFTTRLTLGQISTLSAYAAQTRKRDHSGQAEQAALPASLAKVKGIRALARICPVHAEAGQRSGYGSSSLSKWHNQAQRLLAAHLSEDDSIGKTLRALVAEYAPAARDTLKAPATAPSATTLFALDDAHMQPVDGGQEHGAAHDQPAADRSDPASELSNDWLTDGASDARIYVTATTPPARAAGHQGDHSARRALVARNRRGVHGRLAHWWTYRVERHIWPVALVLLMMALLVATDTPVARVLPLAALRTPGWIITRQWLHGETRTLVVVDPRTGDWRMFWPLGATVNGKWQPDVSLANLFGIMAPAYAPATHLLAFISTYSDGEPARIWLAHVTHGSDGWPVLASPPTVLVADCGGCGTVAWAPDGRTLLYNAPHGLDAVAVEGGKQRSVTQDARDAWPACSPDGGWLAFQHAGTDIVALPATDCLPGPHAWYSARYLIGYSDSWAPAWSPDGQTLAFASNSGTSDHVYTTQLAQMSTNPTIGDRNLALQLPNDRCVDPTWATRSAPLSPVLVYTCNPGDGVNLSELIETTLSPQSPAYSRILDGPRNRDSICWLPDLTE